MIVLHPERYASNKNKSTSDIISDGLTKLLHGAAFTDFVSIHAQCINKFRLAALFNQFNVNFKRRETAGI